MINVKLTEVRCLPGSPNVDRQKILSLPRGRIAPGSCHTGIAGRFMGTAFEDLYANGPLPDTGDEGILVLECRAGSCNLV